jgi:hypothetical protein
MNTGHEPFEHDLVEIYLSDHWAAAGGGSGLARRFAAHNRRSPWAADLELLAAEIAEDDAVLDQIRMAFGIEDKVLGRAKRVAVIAAERIGRLKPNGRVITRSPLTALVECEAMVAGIQAKRLLWEALDAGLKLRPELAAFDLRALASRATSQLALLADFHRDAAERSFGQPVTAASGRLPA